MTFHIETAWLLAVFYTTLRLGAVLLMSPILSGLGSLVTVRVLLVLALSVMLVNGLKVPLPAHGLGPLLAGALLELALGVMLAFGVHAGFASFTLAGKVLDIQSGLGMGSVYDPVTRSSAPLFGTLLNMVAVVVFFALDGHHAFLRGLAYSLQQVPPGTGLAELPAEAVLRQFGLMFSLAVSLVIPVMLCLLLAEAALAMVSRVLPQMNMFVIGVPVKIVAAMLVLMLTAGSLGPAMERVYGGIFTYWEQVLG
ncbi:MAG TPA: flagellar biosynthetic protein FliR [Pseudoduganella sp.]